MQRVGAGIGYRDPNRAATQPRLRGGANQTWPEVMDAPHDGRGTERERSKVHGSVVVVRVLLDVSAVPRDPRGAGFYVLELATSLARRRADDVEMVLLTARGDGARWRAVVDDPTAVTVVEAVPGPRPARLAWEQVAAARTGRRHRIDVWHGPHYTLPLRCRGLATVMTVHDLTLLEHPEWHERSKAAYFGRMIPAAVARATACICVSAHTARRLDELVPPPAGTGRDVTVIPHGVDHARFRPLDPGTDRAVLDRIGVRPPYVAFLGTIEPRKDVPSAVAAFARTAADRPDLRLVLAGGSGWDGGAVQRAISASGVAHRIVRTGYVPDDAVPALLRQAGAVLYPSLEEGFGLPALEALACGAPVVTTAGSAIEEFVGDAALLVPPGDTDALARALDRALDPVVAAILTARGPRQAAPYTWEAVADAHLEVYRRAAAHGGR